jgi:hypothetical protein
MVKHGKTTTIISTMVMNTSKLSTMILMLARQPTLTPFNPRCLSKPTLATLVSIAGIYGTPVSLLEKEFIPFKLTAMVTNTVWSLTL